MENNVQHPTNNIKQYDECNSKTNMVAKKGSFQPFEKEFPNLNYQHYQTDNY